PVVEPAKMTSSGFSARSSPGLIEPVAQRIESETFDFPEPFGPTTTATPGSSRISTGSTNDLKPRSLITFRCTRREASAPDGRRAHPGRELRARSSAPCGEFLAAHLGFERRREAPQQPAEIGGLVVGQLGERGDVPARDHAEPAGHCAPAVRDPPGALAPEPLAQRQRGLQAVLAAADAVHG